MGDEQREQFRAAVRQIRDEVIRIHLDWRFWATYLGFAVLMAWIFDLPLL